MQHLKLYKGHSTENSALSAVKDKSIRAGNVTEKPRLWVVTEVYYPEQISTGYYLTSIVEGLTDEFDVHVICCQPNYAARGVVAPNRETRNGVEIFRAPSTTLDKNVIFYRVINMLTLGVFMFWKSLI